MILGRYCKPRRITMRALIFIALLSMTSAKPRSNRDDRNIIGCHTTDFVCFKRQFRSLRDNFLLGNKHFGIDTYHPYTFKNAVTKTCVQLTGLEESELAGIQIDSVAKEFLLVIELPFRIQQVMNDTAHCYVLDSAASDPENPLQEDSLKKFIGNATIQITYPFRMKVKKGDVYLSLSDENLDVVLDIPDLSQHKNGTIFERKLYELSEWAYMVVQNVDAAQYFALPFTSQIRMVYEYVPLHRLIELYPDEEYIDLNFKFSDDFTKCKDMA